ncbi:MAG: hypothetical protein IJ983_03220, partial [Kiritimatiellae bacterium]|nr:hypothetical protein [Kiritimatiellia bacterium]
YYRVKLLDYNINVELTATPRCGVQRYTFPKADAWAARYILTVDELEERTGMDFNPDLPDFIQRPIEAERPSRLWPVRFRDILSQIFLRFS